MPVRPDWLTAWRAFLEAHARVTEALEAELREECGLPLAWYDVLVQVAEAPSGLRMQELARAVLLSKSGLTRLVDRMEEAGLVARQADASDRRALRVVLTPAGREALRRATPVHLRGVRRHFASRLEPGDAEALTSAVGRVIAPASR